MAVNQATVQLEYRRTSPAVRPRHIATKLEFDTSLRQRGRQSHSVNRTDSKMASNKPNTNGLVDDPFKHVDPDIDSMENDARWTVVDQYALKHLHTTDNPWHKAIEHAAQNSAAKGLPDIAASALQGKYLAVQCRIARARNVLEVGSLGAYSTIWMASASPEIRITTLEIDEGRAAIARENIAFAGLNDRIKIVVGAALDVLPQLEKDVQQGKREKFDFTFIDADKANAPGYFDWAVKLSVPHACIIVDNMVRKGLLAAGPSVASDANLLGIKKTLEAVGKDDRVEATLVQTVSEKNYDGFLVAVKKE